MSPTCRRHVHMSPNLGRHCVSLRHRRGPDIPNLYQLLPTSTNQPKHTGTLAIIEFLCLSLNNNHEITDMSGIPRHVVKCRCVCDMTETCRRHVTDTTQNVAVWATKRHADIRHVELRLPIANLQMVLLVTNVMETMLAKATLTKPKLDAAVAMDTQPAIKWGWAILLPKVVALEMRRVPILAARLLLRKIVALGTTRAMQLGLT